MVTDADHAAPRLTAYRNADVPSLAGSVQDSTAAPSGVTDQLGWTLPGPAGLVTAVLERVCPAAMHDNIAVSTTRSREVCMDSPFLIVSDEEGTRSKQKLDRDLHQARRRGVHYLPEQGGIDTAVHGSRAEELSVIEDVERLQPELKRFGLPQPRGLEQRHIEIQRPRPMKRPA